MATYANIEATDAQSEATDATSAATVTTIEATDRDAINKATDAAKEKNAIKQIQQILAILLCISLQSNWLGPARHHH